MTFDDPMTVVGEFDDSNNMPIIRLHERPWGNTLQANDDRNDVID
jgi:hypothetical protein